MKTRVLMTLAVFLAGVFLFFNLTTPSTFDFLMVCPDRYWAENLFCYPEDMIVDTAAFNWIGRIMMISDPIVFEL